MGDGDTLLEDEWGERQATGLLSRIGIDLRETKKGIQARFAPRGRWCPPGEVLSECIENLLCFGPVRKVEDVNLELHIACALAQDGDDVVTIVEAAWEGGLYEGSPAQSSDDVARREKDQEDSDPKADNIILFRGPDAP
mgnify:CR=1 FL=1